MALYTTTGNGNWSGAIWTPSAPAGGPGNGDTVQISHNVTIDAAAGVGTNGAVTIGNSLLNALIGSSSYGTGGAAPTGLTTGTYRFYITITDSGGKQSPVNTEATFALTNGTNARLTMPAVPTGGSTLNLYLSAAGGSANTETLYCSGITTTTLDLTSSGWMNTAVAGVASGGATAQGSATAFPATNTTNAMTIAAGKSVTINANCSIRLRGNTTAGNGSATDTLNGPCTMTFDSSQCTNPAGTSYTYPISNLRILSLSGSNGNRVTVTSDNTSSAANGAIQPTSGGSQSGQCTGMFFDLINLGSATTNAINANLSASGNTLSWSDFTVQGCGQTNVAVADGAVFSLVRGKWSGSLVNESSTWCVFYSPSAAKTTGTRLIDECLFDKQVKFNAALQLSVTASGGKGCVFNNGVIWGSSSDVTTFDGAMVRWAPGNANAMNWIGQFTNGFLYLNQSTVNTHGMDCIVGITCTSNTLNWSNNVIYYSGTDNTGNPFLIDGDFSTTTTCNVRFNLFLPNSGGSTPGAMLTSTSNLTTPRINFDHNTGCVEGQWGLEIGHLQTIVESPNRWNSVGGNLYFGSTANGYIADNIDSSSLQDIIPPAVANYNAQYQVKQTSGVGVFTNEGRGWASKWSVTPDANGVNLNSSSGPRFNNSSATFATWDLSLGGPGTEAHALSSLLAGTANYTVAAWVAYIRAAYRPKNTNCKNVTGTLDTAQGYTVDAAGNALVGTTGAMAWIASGSFPVNTPYVNSNYYNLLDRG